MRELALADEEADEVLPDKGAGFPDEWCNEYFQISRLFFAI